MTVIQTTDREPTPLKRLLAKLGRTLVIVRLVLVGIIFLSGLLRFEEPLPTAFRSCQRWNSEILGTDGDMKFRTIR